MIPMFVIIKILSYLPSFLALRLLNKKIAAAFRPTIVFLKPENFTTFFPHSEDGNYKKWKIDHIKTIKWNYEDFEYDNICTIVNNSNITKMISDCDEYNFKKDFTKLKKLTCTTFIVVLTGGRYSNLTYYKGPYSGRLRKFQALKKIVLTTAVHPMRFNDNTKKIVFDCIINDTRLDLKKSKVESVTIKCFLYVPINWNEDNHFYSDNTTISEINLPGTLQVLKIRNSILKKNMSVFSDLLQKIKIITFD